MSKSYLLYFFFYTQVTELVVKAKCDVAFRVHLVWEYRGDCTVNNYDTGNDVICYPVDFYFLLCTF